MTLKKSHMIVETAMTVAALVEMISDVTTMGGDPLGAILAPSEIRAIAETVLVSGMLGSGRSEAASYPPHLAWMELVSPIMHDCFAS